SRAFSRGAGAGRWAGTGRSRAPPRPLARRRAGLGSGRRDRTRHRSLGSRGDEARVLRENARRRPRRWGAVRALPRGQVFVAYLEIEAAGGGGEGHAG